MNSASDAGEIPASESVSMRPKETAGFAKEVEEVKKYAEAIHSEMSEALVRTLNVRQLAMTIKTNPKLASISEVKMFIPVLSIFETLRIE